MKTFLLLFFVLVPALAGAQTGAVVSYQFQVYAAGVNPATGAPMQTTTIPNANVICNQPAPPAPPANLANPTKLVWDDLTIAGRVCTVDQSAFLLALPIGTGYTGTLTVTDDFGVTSPRSAASNPFSLRAARPAPTGVKIVP